MMSYAQRYACKGCGTSKMLPEHPEQGQRTIRTGCPNCGYISPHRAVGRVVSGP